MLGHQHQWLWPGNRTILEITSMVVKWWIVAVLCSTKSWSIHKIYKINKSANKLLNQLTNKQDKTIHPSLLGISVTDYKNLPGHIFIQALCMEAIGRRIRRPFLCEHSSSWLRTFAREPCRTETPSCFYKQHNIAIFGADFREHSSSWLRTFTLNLFRQNR